MEWELKQQGRGIQISMHLEFSYWDLMIDRWIQAEAGEAMAITSDFKMWLNIEADNVAWNWRIDWGIEFG